MKPTSSTSWRRLSRVEKWGTNAGYLIAALFSGMYAKATNIIREHRVERQGYLYLRKKGWKVIFGCSLPRISGRRLLVAPWGGI
jgi:hypothetical protein